MLLLFPITSQPPHAGRFAVEIPATEKRRAGLDIALRLWIVLDEYNQDVVGKSFYLEPEEPLGRLSRVFFLPVMKEFIAYRARARSEPPGLIPGARMRGSCPMRSLPRALQPAC
ncbi:hypothetical protein ACQR16_29565 [Bradyrhizobium oligotrophicum]|uniref:hypothetical protein n=1 Tax=Bradyrhizobium oligotrophicum TaxID=44255 RepID=UPI003EBB284D